MGMNSQRNKAAISILLMVSLGHLLNDMFQAVIPAIYPMIKESLGLSFMQIGAITLTNQITSSLLQPMVGYFSDKYPRPYGLVVGMCFTLTGLLLLSVAESFPLVLFSVAFVGIGSSVLHPESSKVARLASGGAKGCVSQKQSQARLDSAEAQPALVNIGKGMAQSIFQIGGNVGRAIGPVAVALIVIPHGQGSIRWFALLAVVAIWLLAKIGSWYKKQIELTELREQSQARLSPAESRRESTEGQLYGRSKSKYDIENVSRLSRHQIIAALLVLLILMFSKDFYTANLQSYLTFYMIDKFGLSVTASQYVLFAYLVSTAIGLLIGGEVGDRYGRKYVIWVSILGSSPFALLLPYCNLTWTIILVILVGMVMSSAMSAILVYATELLPGNVGMISGAFFGLAFGLGGIGSALFGWLADYSSIQYVFQLTAFLPLLGIVTYFLPNIKEKNV
jgi:FSR family fosmidomycin resistance protein-like MFS transporter